MNERLMKIIIVLRNPLLFFILGVFAPKIMWEVLKDAK